MTPLQMDTPPIVQEPAATQNTEIVAEKMLRKKQNEVIHNTLQAPNKLLGIPGSTANVGLQSNKYQDSTFKDTTRTVGTEEQASDHENRQIDTPALGPKLPSAQYAQFILRRETNTMAALLRELRDTLDKPEGTRIMTTFRQTFAGLWDMITALPKQQVYLVSSIEEAVRGKKWRELTVGQIISLEQILLKLGSDADISKSNKNLFKQFHKNQIDIYPSAMLDEDEEED